MSVLQIGLNIILAIIAFVLSSLLLNELGVSGTINTLVSLVVAVGVFLANFASRIRA